MLKGKRVAAVIAAGGSSRRMGFDKLLAPLGDTTVIRQSVRAFSDHPLVDEIVVVAGANLEAVHAQVADLPKVRAVVPGGIDRAASVKNGVAACAGELLAIHDGARPFVSREVVTAALEGVFATGCAAPAVPVKDTVKRARAGRVLETPAREELFCVQTPQVVEREKYVRALAALGGTPVTDDCMVMEHAGFAVTLTPGDYQNRKITTPEDLPMREKKMRIGHGYDVHRLVAGRPLVLGGVTIPFEKGLLGHSDADVLTHAVMDALLGAAALGDIGKLFPDNDPAYEGADSLVLLGRVAALLREKGFSFVNLDATVLCQRPKLAPYNEAMRARLAQALGCEADCVSVKATTEEGLGFTGSGEGIAAHCVALLYRS